MISVTKYDSKGNVLAIFTCETVEQARAGLDVLKTLDEFKPREPMQHEITEVGNVIAINILDKDLQDAFAQCDCPKCVTVREQTRRNLNA